MIDYILVDIFPPPEPLYTMERSCFSRGIIAHISSNLVDSEKFLFYMNEQGKIYIKRPNNYWGMEVIIEEV